MSPSGKSLRRKSSGFNDWRVSARWQEIRARSTCRFPILISADLLKTRLKDPADLELAATIETSTQRGIDTVKRVLAFAHGSQ